MRLLLLSNSTNSGELFLEYAVPYIRNFLGSKSYKILFVPYAIVGLSYDLYYQKVKEKFNSLGYDLDSLHFYNNPELAIQNSDCIIVGGGNTFHLLNQLQVKSLVNIIARSVKQGYPYIGWSAGINIVCPTICTTNDMPITEVENLKGLNLIPFQINPHYTDAIIEGHSGENREQRIEEYLAVNQYRYVIGLREGSGLKIESETLSLFGNNTARIFKYGTIPIELSITDDLNFILHY
jgi:dipeptidase E